METYNIHPEVQSKMEADLELHFLDPIDEAQKTLSDTFLAEQIDAIRQELEILRDWVDERNEDILIPNKDLPQDEVGNYEYPIGLCFLIRDQVLNILPGLFHDKDLFPGLHSLGQFVEKGGIFKAISGIQNKAYFQNAIQAGTYILDVANDTVDTTQPKVVCSSIENSGIENIDDFELQGQVIESYWGQKVYPNLYFPKLAPLYPIITIERNGTIRIVSLNESITAANILNGFQNAEEFLTKSRFAQRRLPKEILDIISGSKNTTFQPNPMSTEELERIFSEHRKTLSTKDMLDLANQSEETVSRFNTLKLKHSVLEEIADGLNKLVQTLLNTPIIKKYLRGIIEKFEKNVRDHNLTQSQIGEVALLIFNELRKIIERPEIENPNTTPHPSGVEKTVESTMELVNDALSIRPPVPKLLKIILTKAIDRCEELISKYYLTTTEIKQIGEKTWEKVGTPTRTTKPTT